MTSAPIRAFVVTEKGRHIGAMRETRTYLSKSVAMLSPSASFRRTPKSRFYKDFWTPVFAGVTTLKNARTYTIWY
jgi:hypothetical protein